MLRCHGSVQLALSRSSLKQAARPHQALSTRTLYSRRCCARTTVMLAAAAGGEPAVALAVPQASATAADNTLPPKGWRLLGAPASELRLEFTLPTGQSFRWQQTGAGEYSGVIGQRVVRLRQLEDDVAYQVVARGPDAPPPQDYETLHDYFNLGTSLAALAGGWSAADPRFAFVHPYFQGARMLRQDPVECLFQFICSSNNHISRIHGMVSRLCAAYGTPLHAMPAADTAAAAEPLAGAVKAKAEAADVPAAAKERASSPQLGTPPQAAEGSAAAAESADGEVEARFYAFPTLDQLAKATEEALRADGFGYRAKFITGSVAELQAKPGGGAAWLRALRGVPYEEAAEQLATLPGIGPKVAACVCLFSLDKHEAIPVDTHVWALATRYYTPHLRGKALTKKVHGEVQTAFVERFGPYAGWAHNTLFISELASMRDRLPAAAAGSGGRGGKRGGASERAGEEGGGKAAAGQKRQRKKSAAAVAAAAAESIVEELVEAAEDAGAAEGSKRKGRRAAAVFAEAADADGQQGGSVCRRRKAAKSDVQ